MIQLFEKMGIPFNSTETGTLLLKAGCRAGVPEKALQQLKDHEQIPLCIGGCHYVMVNFALKKVKTFLNFRFIALEQGNDSHHNGTYERKRNSALSSKLSHTDTGMCRQ